MLLRLNNLSQQLLEMSRELPADFPGRRLPGGEIFYVRGSFGDICLQQLAGLNCMIGYHIFRVHKQFLLEGYSTHKGLFGRVMLRNQLRHRVNGLPEIQIRDSQFTLLVADQPIGTMEFNADPYHECFDVYFAHSLLEEILPLFPELAPLFAGTGPRLLILPARRAGTGIMEAIHAILHCNYEPHLRKYYTESRIKDLLFQFMLELREKPKEGYQPSARETDAVYKAAAIIMADLLKHTSIPELSRKVSMNEYHFKLVFKQVFGMGAYEYRQTKRLDWARQMLDQGRMTVKEAAISAGYKTGNFVNTFRKHYGYTPGTIPRKRNKE